MINFFASYVREDNTYEDVQKVMEALCSELRTHLQPSKYFIDVESYDHGKFPDRILSELKLSDFLVVFLTPLYLLKPYTQAEYLEFLDVERKLERSGRRVIVLYCVRIESFREIHIPGFMLEDLRTRNGFDWCTLRNRKAEDSAHRDAITKLGASIRSELTNPHSDISLPAADIAFNALIPDVLGGWLDRIRGQLGQTHLYTFFRRSLIEGILADVSSELESLNRPEYHHNISLNKNFVTRARPLFGAATEIYAISIDAFSPFWTSKTSLAEEYLEFQPKLTHRMFVFSDQQSMLRHRWVLAANHNKYGRDGHGLVLFTNRDSWENFLREISSDATEEDKNWALNKLSADFGLLMFNPLKELYYEAVLSHEDLSFKEVVVLSKMQRRIIELFKGRPTDGRIDLGASGIAMKWQPAYEREDDKWYRAVAETFRGRSMEQEDVAHIVLFSRRISKNEFQAHMEKILPRLIDIKGAKGKTLVKGHWYGSRVNHADDKPRDSRYGMPLLVMNEVSEVWPHCMILYFDSQDELYEYYKHPTHSDVRIGLYKSFDDRIETLLKALDEGKIEGKARDLVNEFIEKIVSEYIKRLDLMTPTPYANFKLVKAPGFAQYPSE